MVIILKNTGYPGNSHAAIYEIKHLIFITCEKIEHPL